jgi:hypothetical protein
MDHPSEVVDVHERMLAASGARATHLERRSGGYVHVVEKGAGRPVLWIMYGFSVVHCLPVGRADHEESVATGTAMRPATLRAYARDAGFAEVEILPIENDFWRFYRLNPRGQY